ncbi:hypothetical protein GQ607_007659 [Colletotrichum asianum]|uniref:Het and ankyrin domain protein n=1 Tax=Colletotrichum asianum TaxID=702518 RepID=A0A8H3WIE4_9PEZI|nr:hypothetical protein GQ607_007659 [Colletotrichum asianum]
MKNIARTDTPILSGFPVPPPTQNCLESSDSIRDLDRLENTGGTGHNNDVSTNGLLVPSITRSRSSSQSRKRQKSDNDAGYDSDDDSGRKGPPKTNGDSDFPAPGLFACPYFKKDPVKHLSCFMRFKLRRVKDVKQHLNRKHSQPEHHCPSCWIVFENQTKCDEHIMGRSCVPQPRPERYIDAMSADQKRAIGRRIETGLHEKERWYNAWRVLFPDVPSPSSPFLKATELEELISTVRWFWKQNSNNIVSTILCSPQGLDISQPGSVLPSSNNSESEETSDHDGIIRLTDTMDILLDRFEDAIQSLGRHDPPSPPISYVMPSPLLSESGFSTMSEGIADSLRPRIEVSDCIDSESTPRSGTTGLAAESDCSPQRTKHFAFSPFQFPDMTGFTSNTYSQEIRNEDFDLITADSPSQSFSILDDAEPSGK